MTRKQIRDLARDIIPCAADDDFFTDTRLNRSLNVSYKKLVKKIQEIHSNYFQKQDTSTITTVATQYLYTLPTDFVSLRDIFDSNGVSLLPRPQREFNVEDDGTAVYFDFYGNTQIWLYPTPDAVKVYTLNYVYMPVDLTSDNESVVFPVDWEYLIAYDLAMTMKIADGDASVGILAQTYNEGLRSMLRSLKTRQTFDPRRVLGGIGNFGSTDV